MLAPAGFRYFPAIRVWDTATSRQLDSDLQAGEPVGHIGDVGVAQILGDDRHLIVLPGARSERLELLLDILWTFAGEVLNIRVFADTIDAMKTNIAGERAGGGSDPEKHRVR